MFGRGKKSDAPQYEYQTESLTGGLFRGATSKVDKRIAQMQRKGWEYVTMERHGMADRVTLQFRRQK